jgi:hypothetical protein
MVQRRNAGQKFLERLNGEVKRRAGGEDIVGKNQPGMFQIAALALIFVRRRTGFLSGLL